MTILGPVIFASFLILPMWFATMEDKEEKIVAVIDSSHLFQNKIPETEYIRFQYLNNISISNIKKVFKKTDYYAVLYISHTVSYVPNAVQLFSDKQPNIGVVMYIESAIEKEIERLKLNANGIDENLLKSIKTDIKVNTFTWTETGEEKQRNTDVVMAVGYIGGFLIYFFIFLFGATVMRGVLEEKTSRIVEIIISSVKPFQLMMGKIIGIGLVALTQFALWVLLTIIFVSFSQNILFPELKTPSSEQIVSQDIFSAEPVHPAQINQQQQANPELIKAFGYLKEIDFGIIIGSFIFYFLAGYLLYASLFAIVGSACDQDTDTQQFMMPVTIPLILAIFVMINAIQNPESSLAFWFSLIPFTSPIVMMVRIPFGVPYWQVWISMGLLVLTFIGTTWIAAKIYRIGILMYGKKATYKELWKWIRYKT